MSASKQWVVLLRHGIAEERGGAVAEEERALTSRGRRRMRSSARGLVRLLPPIDTIASSPLRRCVETAHFISARTGISDVELLDELRPEGDRQQFLRYLRGTKGTTAVYVGHEPSLSQIATELLGVADASHLELRKGGCYVFTITAGVSHFEWMLAPRVLRSIR